MLFRSHDAWTKKFDRAVMRKALLGGETIDAFAKRHKVSRSAVYKAMDLPLRRKLAAKAEKVKGRRGRKLMRQN